MVTAFCDGSPVIRPRDIVPHPRGIAKSILRGDPSRVYPYVREIVKNSGGTLTGVSEAAIRQARRWVETLEGLHPCFTAAAAVAGLCKQVKAGRIRRDETILVNLTGGDRAPDSRPQRVIELERDGQAWRPRASNNEMIENIWNHPLQAQPFPGA